MLKPVCVLVAQSCLSLCSSMDYSLPGSSAHGILQARILEWASAVSENTSLSIRRALLLDPWMG